MGSPVDADQDERRTERLAELVDALTQHEVELPALRRAGRLAAGGVAVITLEPCNHFGKTPPCAEALVDAGVAKQLDLQVVVPIEDMRELPSTGQLMHPAPADGQEMDIGTERSSNSIWPSIGTW